MNDVNRWVIVSICMYVTVPHIYNITLLFPFSKLSKHSGPLTQSYQFHKIAYGHTTIKAQYSIINDSKQFTIGTSFPSEYEQCFSQAHTKFRSLDKSIDPIPLTIDSARWYNKCYFLRVTKHREKSHLLMRWISM